MVFILDFLRGHVGHVFLWVCDIGVSESGEAVIVFFCFFWRDFLWFLSSDGQVGRLVDRVGSLVLF